MAEKIIFDGRYVTLKELEFIALYGSVRSPGSHWYKMAQRAKKEIENLKKVS